MALSRLSYAERTNASVDFSLNWLSVARVRRAEMEMEMLHGGVKALVVGVPRVFVKPSGLGGGMQRGLDQLHKLCLIYAICSFMISS